MHCHQMNQMLLLCRISSSWWWWFQIMSCMLTQKYWGLKNHNAFLPHNAQNCWNMWYLAGTQSIICLNTQVQVHLIFFGTHGFVIFVMHICIQTLLEHGSCAMDYCNCWKGIWHLKDLVDASDAMIFFPFLAVPRSCFLQWQAHRKRLDATPPAVAVPSDPRTPFHENTWNLEACEKIYEKLETYGKHMVEKKWKKKLRWMGQKST